MKSIRNAVLSVVALSAIIFAGSVWAIDKALAKRASLDGTWGEDCEKPGPRTVYKMSPDGVLTVQVIVYPNTVRSEVEFTKIESRGGGQFYWEGKGTDKGTGPFTAASIAQVNGSTRKILFTEVTSAGEKKKLIDDGKIVATGKEVPLQYRCE